MKFEQMFRDDFIRHLMDHDFKSKSEALDVWNIHGEEYIEDMYQYMSNSIWHYKIKFDNDNGEPTFHKEVA